MQFRFCFADLVAQAFNLFLLCHVGRDPNGLSFDPWNGIEFGDCLVDALGAVCFSSRDKDCFCPGAEEGRCCVET